jgi:hypothetical protein
MLGTESGYDSLFCSEKYPTDILSTGTYYKYMHVKRPFLEKFSREKVGKS